MSRRYLFTRGRRVLYIYLLISAFATLIFFRIFRQIIMQRGKNTYDTSSSKLKVLVPDTSLDGEFQHGKTQNFKTRPIITSLNCEGANSYNRICKMQNICYSPNMDRFFALTVDDKGLKKRWGSSEENRLLDLTTVDDHNVFYFEFDENPDIALRELERSHMEYILVRKKTFIFARFVYNNIMHNIHDDFIGQYILHKKYSAASSDNNSIDTDNFLFFMDGSLETPNDHLFATLSKFPFMYREYMRRAKTSSPPICFENAIVGNSKEGIWYDYGFHEEPQGPVSKAPIVGKHVFEAADFLRNYYKISLPSATDINNILKKIITRKRKDMHKISMDYYISIFSRTQDRLLLNERDLVKDLEETFGLPVKLVQMENLQFNEIIEIMSKTVVSLGLHGAALIFSMFMPAGSSLIEMFPYAIPGENYSPYRTLTLLPEISLNYRMWVNSDPTMSYAQPGIRKRINNLTADEFTKILSLKTVPPHICCGDLSWLVRIYQDTVVNIDEINEKIRGGIRESINNRSNSKKVLQSKSELLAMTRGRVKDVDFSLNQQNSFAGNDKIAMFQLKITWENPWKPIKKEPSGYGIWVEEMFEEIRVSSPSISINACAKGSEINIWIRPYRFEPKSMLNEPAAPYSRKFSFKCE